MGTWQKLADDWSVLSDAEKIALFEGTGYSKPTGAELEAIGEPFKIAIYDVVSSGQSLEIHGVPKEQTVVPLQLISVGSFANVYKIDFVYDVTGNGSIRLAATNNLTDYYVYNSATGTWDSILIEDIGTDGMLISTISNLTSSAWNTLNISEGVAFAYVISMDSSSDTASVDKLTFEGDTSNSYRSQVKGTIYDYEYISDDILRIKIYANGHYKINYKKKNDGGGGGGTSIKEWQPNTSYSAGDLFIYEKTIYEVDADFTSGTTFDDTNCTALDGNVATSAQILGLFI